MLPGIGLFGAGPLVKVLVPILRQNGFKIEALWCRRKEDAQELAKELGISFYTNVIDEVLLRKDVDLIFVLCSPNFHAQISVKALGIGKHIVCDKPGGLNQEDALKMVRAGQYYPTLISIINHAYRFLPAFVHMKKLIQDSYVGKKISVIDVRIQSGKLYAETNTYDWRCDDLMGGGILNLIGSHVVDLVTFLTGQRAIKAHGVVRAFTKTTDTINGIRQISAPDFCSFQLELDKGTLVTATINSHTINNAFQQEVIVSGDEGHLIVVGGDLYGRKGGEKYKEDVLYVDVEDLNLSNSIIPKPFVKGLFKMVSALREAFMPASGWVKGPVESAAGFEDGLYTHAVVSAIRESSQTRQWININVLTEQPDSNALLSAAVRRTAF